MKRINELQSYLDDIVNNKNEVSKDDLLACIHNTVNYLDEMKDIRLSGDAKVETRKLVYHLHDRLCINNE